MSSQTDNVVGDIRSTSQPGFFFLNVDDGDRSFRRDTVYFAEIIFIQHDISDNQNFTV